MYPVLNVVELFCGHAAFTQSFKQHGHNTWCTDKRKRTGVCNPDLRIPIEKLTRSLIPFDHVHVLWGSFPCTGFSYGAGNYYYDGKYIKENGLQFLKLLKKTLNLVDETNPDFFFLENPRGKARYEKLMIDWLINRSALVKEITLGSYGFSTIKPTDIFTNAYDWQPRAQLPYGRGAKNPGLKLLTNLTTVQRQSTPAQLADELREYVERKYPGNNVPGALNVSGSLNVTGT